MHTPNRTVAIVSLVLASAIAGCGKSPEGASTTESKVAPASATISNAKAEFASHMAKLSPPPLAKFSAPFQVPPLSELAAASAGTLPKPTELAIDLAIATMKDRIARGDGARPHVEEGAAEEIILVAKNGDVAGARKHIAKLEDPQLKAAMSAYVETCYGSAPLEDAIEKVATLAPKVSGRFMGLSLMPLLGVEPIHPQWAAKISDALLPEEKKFGEAIYLARQTLTRSGDRSISPYRWFHQGNKADQPSREDASLGQLLSEAVATSWKALAEGEANLRAAEPPRKGEFETTPAFEARKAAFEKEVREAMDEVVASRQGRFRGYFGRELSNHAQWKLKDLVYDADRQRFTANIETSAVASVIKAEIPVAPDAAQWLKNVLQGAVITPVFDAPIDGELAIKKLVFIEGGYAAMAELNWATGVSLSQSASEMLTLTQN
ncbi:hypothetical protein [Piscinibacter sp.]|uniref:hypothetical protein n=1 Tax=Piscinibacter sp. TaxID=1903157 RepID=UPI0035AFC251